jgi:hypothetical protein
MNSKSKKKRNKIPLYPSKNKPINKKEKKPKIASILHHWKQPSTPSFTNSKKFSSSNNFNTIYCNSCNNNNTSKSKDNKSLQNNSSKQNLFHAFIPKSKSNTEVKLKKQKITLIKKINKSKFIPFNFKNIKEFNYKKDIKDHNFDINNNKNEYKNGINEKDTLSSYNSHNMNNTKANTNSNTTIGMSQLYSDRYSKDNNNKIMQELNNPMEFTFGNLNYFQTQNNKETKTTLISSNTLNMPFISIDNNKHFQSLDNNDSANKNMFMKNLIKNIKLINSKMKINNNKNNSEKSNDNNINNKNYNNIKSYSIEKDYYKKKEKKRINKILTLPIWPKANIDKKDFQMSCNEFHKSQKLSKKGSDLIPFDKKYINKKHKLIIKKQYDSEKNNRINNIRVCISTKNKDNKKHLHKLFIKQNSAKCLTKKNKSSPKLFLKHPSLKNLFDQ